MSKNVLFLCTHNSARSQMAEGLLNTFHGDRYEGYSAGVTPTKVNPYVIKAMSEIGIDISGNRSKSIEEFRGKTFNYVVTVCDSAREACPFFPGEEVIHQAFDDPNGFTGSRRNHEGCQTGKRRNQRVDKENFCISKRACFPLSDIVPSKFS